MDDASSLEGTRWAVGTAASASAVLSYFVLTHATAVTNVTCSASGCRAASKAASQARWFAKPENQSYFRGPVNVARVQTWRARHPGYWRKGRCVGPALQDVSMAQPIGSAVEAANAARSR